METTNAQTYKYVLGLIVHPARRRVTPSLGVDIGAITYAFTSFDERTDTRGLWSIRAEVTVELGRHAFLAEGRRSAVSNPPFGPESFHPYEWRAGIALRL